MTPVVICLLICGFLLIAVSFMLPEKTRSADGIVKREYAAKEINKELEQVKKQITDITEEKTDEISEMTERKLEKISNEKILAVNEYSEAVLDEIQKSHTEVMFLYSMLNDKEKEVKDTLKIIKQTKDESLAALQNAEKTMKKVSIKKKEENPDKQKNFGAKATIRKSEPDEKTAGQLEQEKQKEDKALEAPKPDIAKKEKKLLSDQEKDNNNEIIIDLYRQGKSKVQIAKELGIGLGEVKLVIDLFAEGEE